jgi:hypothetical protein
MKKYIILVFVALSTVLYNGCEFDTLPINVPISIPVGLSGSQNSVENSKSFCLDEYESYSQYLEDMESITYIESAFRVDSLSSVNLTGNLKLELKTQSGQILFSKELNNIRPADYRTAPYVLPLTGDQINLINQYISNMSNKCFTASVSLTNISGGTPPYYVGGIIDMVFEAETEL